jgi:hypothetical protein
MNTRQRHGLILLIVLGMLSVFSLLAISFVVFSNQSRVSNFGMLRRDFRGMSSSQMLDQVFKQALRGTRSSRSAVGAHDLLGDVYGYRASWDRLPFAIRTNSVVSGDNQPRIFAGRFLKIPMPQAQTGNVHDRLTGRVLTFLEGPLQGISFRIVRSIGSLSSTSNNQMQAQGFSVIIDLDEAEQQGSDWMSLSASELCVGPGGGYSVFMNARELSGFGYGIPPQFGTQNSSVTTTNYDDGIVSWSDWPVSFQPGFQSLSTMDASTANNVLTGDSNESYDAADYNDFWLSYVGNGGQQPGDIIPSFHRPALINYIVNSHDLADTDSFDQYDFVEMLTKIERACARPLAISVVNIPDIGGYASESPTFDGGNLGTANAFPTLRIDLQDNWNNWTQGNPSPLEKFRSWVRLLIAGPWDVDNDGDGVTDSVWIDPDLPLITGPNGKLLKALVAYSIEDFDSRLDLNATGNLTQVGSSALAPNTPNNPNDVYAPGTSVPQGFGYGAAEIALRQLFTSGNSGDEEYLRFLETRYGGAGHRPGKGTAAMPVNDLRSGLNGGSEILIGGMLQDRGVRSTRRQFMSSRLPGLPRNVRGFLGLGLDRLGNPLLAIDNLWQPGIAFTAGNVVSHRDDFWVCTSDHTSEGDNEPGVGGNWSNVWTPIPLHLDDGTDDAYESRLVATPHQDAPFTIPEWERLYRRYDWDRTTLPSRLEGFGDIANRIRHVAPRTAHTRLPALAATNTNNSPLGSMFELVQAAGTLRPNPVTINDLAYRQLFPIEFRRDQPMDLNRQFGNGVDDDGDGQIDEPSELRAGQASVYATNSGIELFPSVQENPTADFSNATLDPDLAGAPAAISNIHNGQQSRQLFARQLYSLAMLLLPDPLYMSNRPGEPLTTEARARVLAQWAVNVVDFRDSDHAMTRFPYDPNPFQAKQNDNGDPVYWLPNRDPNAFENGNHVPTGHVVWGMEQPELLLTEAGAFHDLRIRESDDSDEDNREYIQYRIPEGSLFLELFCPRTTSTLGSRLLPGVGADSGQLYTGDGTNVQLNVSAVSPPDNNDVQYPVWRVALSEPHPESDPTAPTPNNISRGTASHQGQQVVPSQVTYQLTPTPEEALTNGLFYRYNQQGNPDPAFPEPTVDRLVWFTDAANIPPSGNAVDAGVAAVGLPQGLSPAERARRVFWSFNDPTINPNLNPRLLGGQYMVVGPRPITYFGSQREAGTSRTNLPNHHRIVLQNNVDVPNNLPAAFPNWATIYSSDNQQFPRDMSLLRPAVTMVAATSPPEDWANSSIELRNSIGLNVSEPHSGDNYYPAPTERLNSDDEEGSDPAARGNDAQGFQFLPADSYYDYATDEGAFPTPFDARQSAPLGEHLQEDPTISAPTPGTTQDWCTAFLQRLSDPERPWHPTFNPYITVDWMPIDLTVFSGEDPLEDDQGGDIVQPNPPYAFAFRSKSGVLGLDPSDASRRGRTFLSYATDDLPTASDTSNTSCNFEHMLPVMGNRPTGEAQTLTTLGFLNSAFDLLNYPNEFPQNSAPVYKGAPAPAPASLVWHNRDFTSPLEMLWVPLSAPGQLMQEFNAPLPNDLNAANPYNDPQAFNLFTHLPNFFQQPPQQNNQLPHGTVGALFELTTTPSPWPDAEKVIPPTAFSGSNAETAAIGVLRPPYNRVSRVVERGRVNINTVRDEAVWQGVEWNYLAAAQRMSGGSSWDVLTGLRSNYQFNPPNGEQIPGLDSLTGLPLSGAYPTRFPGVFKSTFAYGRVPPTRQQPNGHSVLDANPNPISATLLRAGETGLQPWLEPRADLIGTLPMANPYHQYLRTSRLNNLVTNRSNVFGVRVTVGYFEYDPAGGGLGPELGWDTGTPRRHRGFYVVDRSIPVGYRPGEDLNTDNCVLLRRIIE